MATPQEETSLSDVVLTHNTLVVSLTPEHQEQMKQCMHRSGKVTFTMKEITTTKLPHVLHNGVAVD